MATFTEGERADLGTRGLEDNAEELLAVISQIDTAEESGDVRGYVDRLRALVKDLEFAADVLEEACEMAEEREENTCSDCGTSLCEDCHECPACSTCCAYIVATP